MMMSVDETIDNSSMGVGKDLSGFLTNMGDATKGLTSLATSAVNVFKSIQDVDTAMSKIVTKLGTGAQNSEQIKESFGKAYSNVALFGGTFADLQTAQEEFLAINQRNVILSSENLTDLVAVTKVTGVAAKDLLTGFQNAGFSMESISKNMTEVNKISRNMGVNAQVVSSSVVSNLEKLNKFGFPNGVEGLSKMAAKAASLRIDMKSAFQVADDIFNKGPEAAIEISATLQRLGATSGALLDPLKLMDLAQNNLPELQNQLVDLSKQYTVFNEDTKQFEIMPGARKQLNEVAKSLGMSYEEFAKMSLESSKMEKKLSEIDFNQLGLNNISEEDKTMIANMSEMNSGGEYTVKLKNEETGEFEEKLLSQLNDDDLKQIQKGQLSDTEEMKNIAYDQLGLQGQMVAQQTAMNNSISMLIATTDMGTKILEGAQERQTRVLGLEKTGDQKNALDLLSANNTETVKILNQMGTDVDELFNLLNNGGDITQLTTALEILFKKTTGLGGDVVNSQIKNLTFTDGITTVLTKLIGSANDLKGITEVIKKAIGVSDAIITPDGMVTPLEQDSIITMTQGEKFRDNLLGKGTPQPNQTAMIDKEIIMSSSQSKTNDSKNSKIEIAFTHESKGANINVAQEFSKSLRDNTSLQQQLVQQISENIKNYGLTS